MRGLKPFILTLRDKAGKSHLLQMRGLKQRVNDALRIVLTSHLLQMRGLKHYFMCHIDDQTPSHLLQMRGLKQKKPEEEKVREVASFTDAWIETSSSGSGTS